MNEFSSPVSETPVSECDRFGELVDLALEDPEAFAAITARSSGERRQWLDGALEAARRVQQGRISLEDARAALVTVARRHYPPARRAGTRPKNITPKRTAPRTRTQRSARRGTTHSTQSPGDDDDPDPDPIELRIRELVDQAPPLSIGQQRRLRALLGGAAR